MKREAIRHLYAWKKRPGHKPLIVRGARQVGKTWLMKEFAQEAYARYIYINFEENELAKELFMRDYDIDRILTSLRLLSGVAIDSETLIIFDEIQEAPRGLSALKYFQENAPQYDIIAAGSLLGISMHKNESFPVGKVDFMDLYPLSFTEYLDALGQSDYVALLEKKDWSLLSLFRPKLADYLRDYLYVGGMPEVVASFAGEKDFQEVRRLQQSILDAYDRDFSKHAPIAEVPRIRMVWRSIHSQLAKENRKFVYGLIKEGARAREFELAIEWLLDAGLVYKVNRAKKGQLPLSAYEDFSAFKIFMLDVGLMGAMGKLPANVLLAGNTLFAEFKGAMTEQYVMQQLKQVKELSIYYWSAENSRGELDFLLQHADRIIPVEVKAEENLQSKSLRTFVAKSPEWQGVRFSMSDYREQEWVTNVPLYAVNVFFALLDTNA